MRIRSDGNVSINDGNLALQMVSGIDFSAKTPSAGGSQNALLDDYEEGAWTPTIVGGWDNITYNAGVTGGWYTKVGRQVNIAAESKLISQIH